MQKLDYSNTKELHISDQNSETIPQKPVSVSLSDATRGAAIKNAARLKTRAKKVKLSIMASQILVVAIVVGIVAIGYKTPDASDTANVASQSIMDQQVTSVDQIAAANVATSIAEAANLSVETNVSNLSISLNTKTELAQTDSALLAKPQIISQVGRNEILTYTAVAGDTVQGVATKYGISEDTVRWANNLTSDSIEEGKQLKILGATGVLYTAKSGDTAESLASKYKADKDRIITFNDLELTGVKEGNELIIPDGVLPENERPGYVAPAATTTTSSYSSSSTVVASGITVYGNNGYAYGYCTWYAYNRRAELGRPIGGNWGNAATWAIYAAAAGFRVDKNPEPGAVFQVGGGYGHVGVVEVVNGDGSIEVSEMNYVGWNIISRRTIPASQITSYNYIH
ncbi:MAG: LysM peptidoglycan-binding domain-containing protein [Candidatus Woesebacteria bacterium]|jgi:surface antigen